MVLSDSPVTTPFDLSFHSDALDLQYFFAVAFEGDQDNDGAASADLFLEDPLLSAAPGSSLIDPTMKTTSTERSPVDQLLLDPSLGKLMNVFGIESQIDDQGVLLNLAAEGELPSYFDFEQVGVTPLSDITPDKGLSEFGDGGSDNNAIFLDAILDESVVVGKLFLRQCE